MKTLIDLFGSTFFCKSHILGSFRIRNEHWQCIRRIHARKKWMDTFHKVRKQRIVGGKVKASYFSQWHLELWSKKIINVFEWEKTIRVEWSWPSWTLRKPNGTFITQCRLSWTYITREKRWQTWEGELCRGDFRCSGEEGFRRLFVTFLSTRVRTLAWNLFSYCNILVFKIR